MFELSPILEDTSYGVFSLGNPPELDVSFMTLIDSRLGLGLIEGEVIDFIDKFLLSIFDYILIWFMLMASYWSNLI